MKLVMEVAGIRRPVVQIRDLGNGGLLHSDAPSRYRGTSLIRNRAHLGPCSKTIPTPYGGPRGGRFLMSEVPL